MTPRSGPMVIRDAQRRRFLATQMMDRMRHAREGSGRSVFARDPRVVQSHDHMTTALKEYAASHALPRRDGTVGSAQSVTLDGIQRQAVFAGENVMANSSGHADGSFQLMQHLTVGHMPAERFARGIPAGYSGYVPREIRERSLAHNPTRMGPATEQGTPPSRFLQETPTEIRQAQVLGAKQSRKLRPDRFGQSAAAQSIPWPPWPHGERLPCSYDVCTVRI